MDSEYIVNIDEYARLNVNEIKETKLMTVNVFASKIKILLFVRSTWLVHGFSSRHDSKSEGL